MIDVEFRSYMSVGLVDHMGSDQSVCRAAKVSTIGAASLDADESAGMINFLMRNRHGSPFEHNAMTFLISAPIFVWREFMRHRIGFSYNEESGRYKKLEPVFYRPAADRPLIQVGKAGEYRFEPGTEAQYVKAYTELGVSYLKSWQTYDRLLDANVAKEVARMCLPVATYSTAYVTCNARSMMAFLSLRTKDETSMFPSFPQKEINMVADLMEEQFTTLFPLTQTAFQANGRVAP